MTLTLTFISEKNLEYNKIACTEKKKKKLSVIISLYMAKFIKHNRSNTAFLHEIVIIFLLLIYQLIQTKDRVIKVNSTRNDHSMNL